MTKDPIQAPCATKVLGGNCDNPVWTHFQRPYEQNWQYCDVCVKMISEDDDEDLEVVG